MKPRLQTAVFFALSLVLLIGVFTLYPSVSAAQDSLEAYKPYVYYPELKKDTLSCTYRLADKPNYVRAFVINTKDALQSYLNTQWSSSQSVDAARFLFDNKSAAFTIVYRYEWVANNDWNSYYDNYFVPREGPDTEDVVVGVGSNGNVVGFVTHPHYTLQLYDNPDQASPNHVVLYLRGAHHGPYQTPGTFNTFLTWGTDYPLYTFVPADVYCR